MSVYVSKAPSVVLSFSRAEHFGDVDNVLCVGNHFSSEPESTYVRPAKTCWNECSGWSIIRPYKSWRSTHSQGQQPQPLAVRSLLKNCRGNGSVEVFLEAYHGWYLRASRLTSSGVRPHWKPVSPFQSIADPGCLTKNEGDRPY